MPERKILPRFLLALSIAAGAARAQEALNTPVPLVAAPAARSPGANTITWAAAQRAQELGLPGVAAGLYRGLLAAPNADRAAVTLALATALIDDARAEEAQEVLNALKEPRGSPWRLRAGLAWVQLRRIDLATPELAQTKLEELSATDRPWFFYLQGRIFEATDPGRARDLYNQAEAAAVTSMGRVRFKLLRDQAELRATGVTTELLEQNRRNLEQPAVQGRPVGFDLARSYAAMLAAAGKKTEAVALLRQKLLTLPAEERTRADDFRVFIGLIAGADSPVGRAELTRLLESGSDADRQRIALQLLVNASGREPGRGQLRAVLDRLIAAPTPHAALAELYFFSAQLALEDKNYARAEDDARKLLEKYPGSPLKVHALGLLTGSAWEQKRYRTAADNAAKARAELPPGPARAELGVLVAEAWFRAGDFRSSADAYAAALRELPPELKARDVMFQRVEAEIRAGALDAAQKALDDYGRDPAFDAETRWMAEWNLAKALQVRRQPEAALARVEKLIAGDGAPGLKPELRARMMWLRARLSFELGQKQSDPAQLRKTLEFVDALPTAFVGLPDDLRKEIASTGVLLKAQAQFALNNEKEALATLQALRADYVKSDAAAYSFIIEADYYAQPPRDRVVDAQKLYRALVDDENYRSSKYAAYALYQAALQAERLGQDKNLVEANDMIETLVTEPRFQGSELIFYARLRQGDLLRKLNQFPQAERAYRDLLTRFSQHRDVPLAQLALAECINAQSASNPAQAENAQVLFEQLRDRVDAPVDVRVEAGYNLGYLLKRRGSAAKAQEVWWHDVVAPFLLDKDQAAKLEEKGRWWMTKTLVDLGNLREEQGKLEEAKEAWLLVLSYKLPSEALAKAKLARFNLPEAKP